jgi:hypothetical protein
MDEAIADVIIENVITLPILHIRDMLYVVGSERMTGEIRNGRALLRVGGGFMKLTEYLEHNMENNKKKLIQLMILHN